MCLTSTLECLSSFLATTRARIKDFIHTNIYAFLHLFISRSLRYVHIIILFNFRSGHCSCCPREQLPRADGSELQWRASPGPCPGPAAATVALRSAHAWLLQMMAPREGAWGCGGERGGVWGVRRCGCTFEGEWKGRVVNT